MQNSHGLNIHKNQKRKLCLEFSVECVVIYPVAKVRAKFMLTKNLLEIPKITM